MERDGVESPPTCAPPSPPGLLSSSKRPLGGSSERGRSRRVVGRGGLKRGQQSQLDRRTDTHFFLETRTDHEQTRHRGTHILNLFPISSNSDPFRQHHPSLKIHPCAPAQGPHPAPQIRGQRPQARRTIPPLSGSRRPWACSPRTVQSGNGESGPLLSFGILLFPLPSVDLLWVPVRRWESPHPIPLVGLPPLQVAL